MQLDYDPSKTTWLNPQIEYLFNQEIYEYDMADAGFSLIKQFRLLPEEKIRELQSLEKGLPRNIAVGLLQRDDKAFSKALSDKFISMRAWFLQQNQLDHNRIISVKKDAIYTIGVCSKTTLGQVQFRKKHVYSSYLRFAQIQNLELYYNQDGIDVKGMSDVSVNRHRLYWIQFLRTYFNLIESRDPKIKRIMKRFIDNYKFDELEEEFYMEFNNRSREVDKIGNYTRLILPLIQITLREVP